MIPSSCTDFIFVRYNKINAILKLDRTSHQRLNSCRNFVCFEVEIVATVVKKYRATTAYNLSR